MHSAAPVKMHGCGFRSGLSNIRPGGQNRSGKDSNLANWQAGNVKEGIHFGDL